MDFAFEASLDYHPRTCTAARSRTNLQLRWEMDTRGYMVGKALCRPGKLSQSVKYSQKCNSESKFGSTHRYMSPKN
jgi:hypothetical protein